MLLGLENEGRGMGMVCCGCAKCPVGLCRSLQHSSAVTGLRDRGASCGQTDVVVVVRCLSLTPSLVELQIFGSWLTGVGSELCKYFPCCEVLLLLMALFR